MLATEFMPRVSAESVSVVEPASAQTWFSVALLLVGLSCAVALVVIAQRRSYRPRHTTPAGPTTSMASIVAGGDKAAPVELVEPLVESDGGQPMIRVLGPVGVEGVDWDLTPQQLAFVTFLACSGEASRESIIDALWDGKAISTGRFPNLLAEVRARIGRHHLPDSVGGRYRLVGVTTDLAVLEGSLTSFGTDPESHDEAIRSCGLFRAIGLVRGVPFSVPASRYWSWLDWRTELANRAELVVVEAASQLCQRARANGEFATARRVCEIGLVASPLDEGLAGSLVAIELDQGKPTAAGRVVDNWEAQIRRLGCGEPSPRLRACLEQALDRSA